MSSSSGRDLPSNRWSRPIWIPFESYISQHWSHMTDLEPFVEHDGLSFDFIDHDLIRLSGEVRCQFGMCLSVDKFLNLDDSSRVSTTRYKYQAMIGTSRRKIFRYDNAHQYEREAHPDPFHKHIFDPVSDREAPDSPIWIGIDDWPTLRQVLEELHDWWFETGQYLSLD